MHHFYLQLFTGPISVESLNKSVAVNFITAFYTNCAVRSFCSYLFCSINSVYSAWVQWKGGSWRTERHTVCWRVKVFVWGRRKMTISAKILSFYCQTGGFKRISVQHGKRFLHAPPPFYFFTSKP